jgi:hypothetical protein
MYYIHSIKNDDNLQYNYRHKILIYIADFRTASILSKLGTPS